MQVLRLRPGESIRIFNGLDGEWHACLAEEAQSKKKGAVLRLENLLRPQEPDPDLWACPAPIKKQHFDFIIAKATELGVSVIQPVLTDRSQIREVNVERCRAIAIEAAEQSERLSVPDIREPISLDRFIKTWPAKRLAILCAERGPARPIAQALSSALAEARESVAVLTGPEGGYTREELAKLGDLPELLPVRLGPRVLRADTAAFAALACWQALRGDWRAIREGKGSGEGHAG